MLKPWDPKVSTEKSHPYLFENDPVDDVYIPQASPEKFTSKRDEQMDLQMLLFYCDISGARSEIQKKEYIRDYAGFLKQNRRRFILTKVTDYFYYPSFKSHRKADLSNDLNSIYRGMSDDEGFNYYMACKYFEIYPQFLQQRIPMFYRSDKTPTIKFISFEKSVQHLILDEETRLFYVSTCLMNVAKKNDIVVLQTKDNRCFYLSRAPGYLNDTDCDNPYTYTITSYK